jgi:hypothetical protein
MSLECCPRVDDRGACFSENRKYRYGLWRRWKKNGPWVTFLMLNPSLADIEHSDPTVKRCEVFSQKWGFAGIEVVNVFGLISPYPQDLRGRRNPIEHAKGLNDEHIRHAAERSEFVVAAWGTNVDHPKLKKRMDRIRLLLADFDVRALRVTKNGHPSHPLYLPANLTAESFQVGLTFDACEVGYE